jgi:hypothetical protein
MKKNLLGFAHLLLLLISVVVLLLLFVFYRSEINRFYRSKVSILPLSPLEQELLPETPKDGKQELNDTDLGSPDEDLQELEEEINTL